MQEKNFRFSRFFSEFFSVVKQAVDAFFTWWPLDGSGEYTHTLCQAVRYDRCFS
jgi:hypothetical protein